MFDPGEELFGRRGFEIDIVRYCTHSHELYDWHVCSSNPVVKFFGDVRGAKARCVETLVKKFRHLSPT